MSTYKAYIFKISEINEHSNADRLALINCYGEQVIISKDTNVGDIGIYFPSEGQLSHELCYHNNMYSTSELNKDTTKKGYFGKNRRIKPTRFRGEKSEGLWLPMSYFSFIDYSLEIKSLVHGTELTSLGGVEIVKKYVPRAQGSGKSRGVSKSKVREARVPTFKEHFQTEHYFRNNQNLDQYIGSLVFITEKLHGTSGRCGNLLATEAPKWYHKLPFMKPKQDYKFTVGSRKVVKSIDGESNNGNHWYGHDLWSIVSEKTFKDKLRKGETVYFEIVGYDNENRLIMGSHSNEKLKRFLNKDEYDKLITKYGNTTEFTYGCSPEHCKVFVYRITMTNEEGYSIDLSMQQIQQRCKELNVPSVPVLLHGMIDYNGNYIAIGQGEEGTKAKVFDLNKVVEYATDAESDVFPNHLKEGICVRIENGDAKPIILKNKSFIFKVLEGIIKEPSIEDIESAE
mgnify:CR=1 FL=1